MFSKKIPQTYSKKDLKRGTAWLLDRSKNAWTLQPSWGKVSTLIVEHIYVELSLLMTLGLETSDWSWNHSQMSPKHCDELNQKVKEMIILVYDHHGIIMTDRIDLSCTRLDHPSTTTKLSEDRWKVLLHASYSPDMSPPDFDQFQTLKEPIRGHSLPPLKQNSNIS